MTLPALASTDALGVRLGGTLDGADLSRAQAALDDASTLIRAIAGTDWVIDDDPPVLATDLPDIVASVCLAVAERKYRNPDALRSEQLGSYQVAYDSGSGIFLTTDEAALIRRAIGTAAVGSVAMEGPFDAVIPNQFVPVEPDGDPMPWVTLGDPNDY